MMYNKINRRSLASLRGLITAYANFHLNTNIYRQWLGPYFGLLQAHFGKC